MNYLANENVPRADVEAIRDAGDDVAWVRADAPGSPDPVVLARAAEGRVLLTFDKDFGELAFRVGLPSASGVVLIRVPLADQGTPINCWRLSCGPARLTGALLGNRAGSRADALRAPQAEMAAELDALLPAVLNRAFAGEL